VIVKCIDCQKEVEFRDFPGRKLPRRFRCFRCKDQRRRKRRAVRVRRRRGVRDGLAYPTNALTVRTGKTACEMCGTEYTRRTTTVDGEKVLPILEHRHHILPRRLAAKSGDPDLPINILSVCGKCHGTLKRIDQAILSSDWIGAVTVARVVHFPLDRLSAAAATYGFHIEDIVERMQC
jgi:hypothetical protein